MRPAPNLLCAEADAELKVKVAAAREKKEVDDDDGNTCPVPRACNGHVQMLWKRSLRI
jgi:hypothetical protein